MAAGHTLVEGSPAALRPLPHYLRPGLWLVFVGYNPGIESAKAGRYYAHRGNPFWKHLFESGLVGRQAGPADDGLLMDECGIGFVDLCCRPTVRADELTTEELQLGSRRLLNELTEASPRFAVFSGKGIYQRFGRFALGLGNAELASRPYGIQPERLGRGTVPYVVPSSSGLASKWHRERVALLRALKAASGSPEPLWPEAKLRTARRRD